MFELVNNRKCLIIVFGLMFLPGVTEAAKVDSSCNVATVCEYVETKKNKGKSFSTTKREIAKLCDDKMHLTKCPVPDVVRACWDGGITEATARCP